MASLLQADIAEDLSSVSKDATCATTYHLSGWSNSLGRDSMSRSQISLAVG